MSIPEEFDSPYDPQWVQDLLDRFPQISKSPWTVTIRKGWLPLVTKLMEDVVQVCPNIKIVQIKEKFGGLRFYYASLKDEPEAVYSAVWPLVHKAEVESYEICEVCGAPGDLRRSNWHQTLCDSCHRAYLEDLAKSYEGDL